MSFNPQDPTALERATLAALDATANRHQLAASRQTMAFALALQPLRFARMNVRPTEPPDAITANLVAARAAYCDKIREENTAFEALVQQTRSEVNSQAAAATALYRQQRPAAYERLSQILRDLDGQDLGAHGAMNQALLQAQLEDNEKDRFLGLYDLAKKTSELYASKPGKK